MRAGSALQAKGGAKYMMLSHRDDVRRPSLSCRPLWQPAMRRLGSSRVASVRRGQARSWHLDPISSNTPWYFHKRSCTSSVRTQGV